MIFFRISLAEKADHENRKGCRMNWKNMIVGIVAAGAMTAGAGDEVKVDAWGKIGALTIVTHPEPP